MAGDGASSAPAAASPGRGASARPPGPSGDPFFPDLRVRRLVFGVVVAALVVFGLTSVRSRAQVLDVTKHSSDFTCYTAAGAAILAGQDPYSATNPRGWHYVYPPLFAMVVSPLHALHPQVQAVVWFLASVAFAFGSYFECVRLTRFLAATYQPGRLSVRTIPGWLSLTPFLSVFLFGITCLELGQVSIALLFLLLLGLRLILTERSPVAWVAGGVALAGAVVLKVVPALPAGLLLTSLLVAPRAASGLSRRRCRAASALTGAAIGGLAFFLLLPALLVGWRANLTHLQAFVARVATNPNLGAEAHINITGPGNQSFRYAARNLGNWIGSGGTIVPKVTEIPSPERETPLDGPAATRAVRCFLALSVAMLLAAGWRLARAASALALATGFALACTATLLLSPISWSHSFVLFLPAALFVPFWVWRRRNPRLALLVAVIPILLELQHYVFRSTLRLVGVLGVGIAVWFLVVCALIVIPSEGHAEAGSDDAERATA